MASQHITLSLPEELRERAEPYWAFINMSKLFQVALTGELDRIEGAINGDIDTMSPDELRQLARLLAVARDASPTERRGKGRPRRA